MLWYPRDNHRPWDALVSYRSAVPSARNSSHLFIRSSSNDLNSDCNQFDQISVNSAASPNNNFPLQPFQPTSDNEPGAPSTAPALSPQRTPPAVFADNEDHQHISIATLNERDRLVAPVLSCSSDDFPPNAPSPPPSSSTP